MRVTLAVMAFAAEHPILSQSEFRPVGDIERTNKPFEVVSDYEPAGDQPQAIKEIDETSGVVAVIGEVFKTDIVETKTGKTILNMQIERIM